MTNECVITPREHFESRARHLIDCASLEIDSIGRGEVLSLVPHNPLSLGVYLLDCHPNPSQVGYAMDHDLPDEDAVDPRSVDLFVDSAVEGRVRELRGSRRASLQIFDGRAYKPVGTHYGVGAWFPIPGWRSRATVIDYEPYRS